MEGNIMKIQQLVVAALVKMVALETDLVQTSLHWLVDHQRFDHKAGRAGGDRVWPYKAPANYGCWDSVSCFHGVAGAFQALAAVPPRLRSDEMNQRLAEAIDYLRAHHVYKNSSGERPIVRHWKCRVPERVPRVRISPSP